MWCVRVELGRETMNCYKCKHPNLHGSNFCEKCGADLKAPPPRVSPVTPYREYPYPRESSTLSSPMGYPAPRPTPAPKPVPVNRQTAASSRAPVAPVPPATPIPPPTPAPRPERQRRRSPVISDQQPRSTAPVSEPPRPVRREPPAFAHLTGPQGRKFPLCYDQNLIGRASLADGINPQVDLTAADQNGTVSRQHARIGKDDSSLFIEDLGSSNGTRHNGQPLREGMQTPLSDGDQIVFGDLVFTFSLTDDR